MKSLQSKHKASPQKGRWLALGLVIASGMGVQAADVLVPGVLKREFFSGATRATIEDGTAGDPTSVGVLSQFDAPAGVADNYAQRVSGFFIPAQSGDYVFFVASDDDSDLFLSTDENPANKRLIAQETQWSNQRLWSNTGDGTTTAGDPTTKRSDNQFGTLSLVANKKYYIEGVHHEGGGGDNFAATFKLTSEDDPADSSASRLTGSVIATMLPAGTITVTTQPQAVTTIEGVTATFSVAVDYTGIVGPNYQWRKNGGDIAGATSASYTTPLLVLGDSGTKYSVKVTVPGAETISSEVTLTVSGDTIPPKVLTVGGLKHGTGVDVGIIFDEKLDPSTVVKANFTLSGGTVSDVRYLSNSSGKQSLESGAIVTATGLTGGSTYTLTVTGVKDAKGNAMAASQTQFKVNPNMTWTALGNEPAEFPAGAVAVADDGFNVNSGGNSYWGTTDDVTFVYEEVTGDFDKVVRVDYQDPSSQWARGGLTARAGLGSLAEEAERYQQVHVNPTIKADGGASNNSWETNRRLTKGGDTSSSSGGGTLTYPNGWCRLRRQGDVIHMYRSYDGVTWTEFTRTNFNPDDGSLPDGPLPAKMFVGPVYGPENGNLTAEAEQFRSLWAIRFRQYGDFKPNKTAGTQAYSIGVNFEDDTAPSSVGPMEIAGVDSVAQANWNSANPAASSAEPVKLVADVKGVSATTSATVEWTSANTWASTGRGEENNNLTGSDHALMAGYLDSGAATTSKVTLTGLPTQLTSGTGYDVVVYTMGGVPNRGGSYRITDANGTELKGYVYAMTPALPTGWVRAIPGTDPTVHVAGNYLVFKGLTASSIILEGTTENGPFSDTPRAPINAVQLVSPTGLLDTVAKPTLSVSRTASGVAITFTGKLQRADSVNGTYSDVAGATSPYTAQPGFYRSAQ
jgi:hypothetical protein